MKASVVLPWISSAVYEKGTVLNGSGGFGAASTHGQDVSVDTLPDMREQGGCGTVGLCHGPALSFSALRWKRRRGRSHRKTNLSWNNRLPGTASSLLRSCYQTTTFELQDLMLSDSLFKCHSTYLLSGHSSCSFYFLDRHWPRNGNRNTEALFGRYCLSLDRHIESRILDHLALTFVAVGLWRTGHAPSLLLVSVVVGAISYYRLVSMYKR